MLKAMIFIDGTWLYYNKSKLGGAGREEFALDYGKLTQVLAAEVARMAGVPQLDVVRTFLFGSYAANYDPTDLDAAQRQRDFFNMLRERHHYEVDTYPVDYKGRRLRRQDREPSDTFDPREKGVDVALASSLLYNAAIHGSMDIAIVVMGDSSFVPALQAARRLGKRLAIASIKDGCVPALSDPTDIQRLKDFDNIWLEEYLERLELVYEKRKLRCESPLHQGERLVLTTYQPTRNGKFYCDDCRALYSRMKLEGQTQAVENGHATVAPVTYAPTSAAPQAAISDDQYSHGIVKAKFEDRGYGFIQADSGKDYFFHFSDLDNSADFPSIMIGQSVRFLIKREPILDKAGAAMRVSLLPYEGEPEAEAYELVEGDEDLVEEIDDSNPVDDADDGELVEVDPAEPTRA